MEKYKHGLLSLPPTKRTQLTLSAEDDLDALNAAVEATESLCREDSVRSFRKTSAEHQTSEKLLSFQGIDKSRKYHDIIKTCCDVYWTTPIIRNIIDLMVDFASEGLSIEHRVPFQQRFYKEWARRTGFLALIPQIFHTLFLCGNCVILRQDGTISQKTSRELSRATLNRDPVPFMRIPIRYTILDPKRIVFERNDFFDEFSVRLKLTDAEISAIKRPQTDKQRAILKSIDKTVIRSSMSDGSVSLNPDFVTVLHYKKLPWETWAMPMVFAALDDINFKKMLRRMDEGSAADVIKAVVIFKLGATVAGIPPDRARFTKLASLLKDPAQAHNIVWDDMIDVVDSFPPIEKILGKEKYEIVDRDILSAFGVSEVLVTGRAGNFSSGFLSVRTLQEKLESTRGHVLDEFIDEELDRVREGIGFATRPSTAFKSMSLRDEQAEKRLIKELLDRRVLSVQTSLEEFGYNHKIEESRLRKEKKRNLPQVSPIDQRDSGQPPKKMRGRPEDTGKPLEVPRDTKPTGIGLSSFFDEVENIIVGLVDSETHQEDISLLKNIACWVLNKNNVAILNKEVVIEALMEGQGIIRDKADVELSAYLCEMLGE